MENIINTTAVQITNSLIDEAKKYSKIENRSATAQIEYWTKIGKCAMENPDLSYNYIKDILAGVVELDLGHSSTYKFG